MFRHFPVGFLGQVVSNPSNPSNQIQPSALLVAWGTRLVHILGKPALVSITLQPVFVLLIQWTSQGSWIGVIPRVGWSLSTISLKRLEGFFQTHRIFSPFEQWSNKWCEQPQVFVLFSIHLQVEHWSTFQPTKESLHLNLTSQNRSHPQPI